MASIKTVAIHGWYTLRVLPFSIPLLLYLWLEVVITARLSQRPRSHSTDVHSNNLPNIHTHTDNVLCTICKDVWYRPVTLKGCGHTFCRRCILQVMQQGLMCPAGCKKVINEVPMLYNGPAIQLLDAYFQKNPEVEKRLESDCEEISSEEFYHQCEMILQTPTYIS